MAEPDETQPEIGSSFESFLEEQGTLEETTNQAVSRVEEFQRSQQRERLPETRVSITHKFEIDGHTGYITVGLFNDGRPGELFLKMGKEGSTIGGLLDAVGILTSVALQNGVPLSELSRKLSHVRFDPSGMTGNSQLPIAKSIIDYVFRWLDQTFLEAENTTSPQPK